jgi:hypothetical protein
MTKIYGITVQVWNTRALPERAARVQKCLRSYESAFTKLFEDENFITLLEAESLTEIPGPLNALFHEAKDRNDIS